MNDSGTIAAISTPQGTGGISVIRISGDNAVEIADKIFTGRSLKTAKTHTIHYGFIKNTAGEKIDEVLVSVMLAPKTFTREDTVEISCHGGSVPTRAVLKCVIEAGARMAQPGEFTKRAFMNGRIDLSRAEAVIDLINSKNELSRRNAVMQLGGSLADSIKSVRDKLVNLLARMQVIIDYPDEDLADITETDIEEICRGCADKTQRLIKTSESGRIIRDGIRTAIVGKPNVGKSSILNFLAGDDRAIVTSVAGTTRDVIEESINLNGIPLVLSDTAGIHDTEDTVERIGVEKSRRYLDAADLVMVVLDASETIDENDMAVIRASEGKKRIVLLNKADIAAQGAADDIASILNEGDAAACIRVSAKTGEGMDKLAEKISSLCSLDKIDAENGAVITNMRHKTALINAHESLVSAVNALNSGMPTDIVSIDISSAVDSLGEITGETVSESVVDEIFHNFCVGK